MLALAACNMAADANKGETGGGRSGERSYDVGGFEGVTLAGAQNVVVTVGGAPSVRAEGDAELLDRTEVKVENGRLWLGTKKGSNWSLGGGRQPVTIYVTTPRLTSASILGAGDMRIDKIDGGRFEGSIAGAGDLEVAALRVDEADLSIAGSGNIRAAGTAARAKVTIAGAGDVDVTGLETRDAQIAIMGSGNIRAKATQTADISVMGVGDVDVTGGARCTIKKGGPGEVRCG
jgi:hypothetical protein